jgi:hypothetical protein
MVALRFAVPAILAAAAAAGCFIYFVTPPSARVEADQRLPPAVLYSRGPSTTASTGIDQRLSADEKAAAAYEKAAAAILRRAANARRARRPQSWAIPLPKGLITRRDFGGRWRKGKPAVASALRLTIVAIFAASSILPRFAAPR